MNSQAFLLSLGHKTQGWGSSDSHVLQVQHTLKVQLQILLRQNDTDQTIAEATKSMTT